MEDHIIHLNKYCRLCCCKILMTHGYHTAKTASSVKDQINAVFLHYVDKDDKSVFPTSICARCYARMIKVDVGKQGYEQAEMANFEAHHPHCLICTKKRTHIPVHQFAVVKIKSLSIDMVTETARKFGFHLAQSNSFKSCYVRLQPLSSGFAADLTINILDGFKWNLVVFNQQISEKNTFIQSLPSSLCTNNIKEFFGKLKTITICQGNDDFPKVVEKQKEDALTSQETMTYVQNQSFEPLSLMNLTLRRENCEIFNENCLERCVTCNSQRTGLRKQENKLFLEGSAVKAKRPHSTLSKKQLRKRLFVISKEKKELKRQKLKLEKKISNLVRKEGVKLDEATNNIVKEICGEASPFEEDSIIHLLWKQQKEAASLKKQSSMRWHPIIIRWCLSIYLRSPGTYEQIRQSGFLKLPHKTTLQQYTSFTSTGVAYNPDVLKRMYSDLKIDEFEEYEKNCSILFDEMKVKSGLVFSRNTGKLVGFTELGDINDEVKKLEEQVKQKSRVRPLATHVLAVMARGLFKRFNYPIGYYTTISAEAEELFPIIWEAVGVLEMVGIKVRAFVCDGASPNRKFFRIHTLADGSNVSVDGVVYWAFNRYDRDRKIFFFSDVPHLLKTMRNNLENSGGNKGSRSLFYNGQPMTWQQIKCLYEKDLDTNIYCPGLRKLPRITTDHVFLTPRTRMRVNLAVQVLSTTMANAFEHQGYQTTRSIEQCIRFCDKFFDCLNVQTTFQGKKSRKEALYPYRDPNDPRFLWLQDVFLKYLNDWEKQTQSIPGSKQYQARHCISKQTLEGFRITVRSFVELVPMLLGIDGVDYFLSDKLNQDPIEEHFSKQRSRGGGVENPTVEQYMLNERKLIVSKSEMVLTMRGNTRGRIRERTDIDVTDNRMLPKRPKKK